MKNLLASNGPRQQNLAKFQNFINQNVLLTSSTLMNTATSKKKQRPSTAVPIRDSASTLVKMKSSTSKRHKAYHTSTFEESTRADAFSNSVLKGRRDKMQSVMCMETMSHATFVDNPETNYALHLNPILTAKLRGIVPAHPSSRPHNLISATRTRP